MISHHRFTKQPDLSECSRDYLVGLAAELEERKRREEIAAAALAAEEAEAAAEDEDEGDEAAPSATAPIRDQHPRYDHD